jgi:hypothetical protein
VQRNRTPPLQGLPVLIESQADHDGLVGFAKPIRIIRSDELTPDKIKKALSPEAWKCFLGSVKLKTAYASKDPLLMREGYQLLAAGRGFPTELNFVDSASSFTSRERGPVGSVQHFLPSFVNQELQDVRIVVWWHSKLKQFMPGILCLDFQSAVYVKLLMDAVFGGGWKMCPRCGKWFLTTPKRKLYHSTRCQSAYRVARWRERKKGG